MKYRHTATALVTGAVAAAFIFSGAVLSAPSASAQTTAAAAEKTAKPQQDEPVSISTSAAGDCTLGTDSHFSYSSSLNAMYARKGPAYFFKKVKGIFAEDDLSIVNLEGTLTNRGSRANKTYAFRGKPSYVKILKKGSIEAVGFANNHMTDYGKVSYNDTIKNVAAAGIKVSSLSRTAIYKTKGVKIGMVSVCSGIEGRSSYSASKLHIRQGIKKLKKQGCKLFIVYMHAGVERKNYPNDQQKSLARYAIDKGANLVLGAHPHVLQGIWKYHDAYIVYSLGNFCFGGNSNPRDKDTMIYRQTFKVSGKKTTGGKAKIIPCRVSSTGSYNNYQPELARGSAKKRIIRRMNSYSSPYKIHFSKKGIANR